MLWIGNMTMDSQWIISGYSDSDWIVGMGDRGACGG